MSRLLRGVFTTLRAAQHVRLRGTAVPHAPFTTSAQAHTRTFITRVFDFVNAAPIRRALPPNVFSHSANTAAAARRGLLTGATPRPSFHPRGPKIPRSPFEVGLNPARKFSSGQPLFSNLAQNVPIATRALLEADWDIQRKKTNRAKAISIMKTSGKKTTPKMRQRRLSLVSETSNDSAFDHYFAAPTAAAAKNDPTSTTCLTIPLAPSTARAPLPDHSATLLDSSVLSLHEAYTIHGQRVASLFRRLDTAGVWARGAVEEFYGAAPLGDGEAVCSIIRARFDGWTEEMVRAVIGEAGIGWCIVEEISARTATAPTQEHSESTPTSTASSQAELDLVNSTFIMPTLDFSASFPSPLFSPPLDNHNHDITATSEVWTSPTSSFPGSPISETSEFSHLIYAASAFSSDSDSDSEGEESWTGASTPTSFSSSSSSSGMGLGFSSRFVERAGPNIDLFL